MRGVQYDRIEAPDPGCTDGTWSMTAAARLCIFSTQLGPSLCDPHISRSLGCDTEGLRRKVKLWIHSITYLERYGASADRIRKP